MSQRPSEADRTPETSRIPESSLRFEEALAQLEAVLRRLEQGQDRLEDALRDYEQGLALLRHCRNLLQHAEWKVQQLAGVDAHGEPRLEPFDHTSRLAQTQQEWSALGSQPLQQDKQSELE
ncbi:MAG: exodeoxyribonuclease VII small subunit [Gemmataceae bacterium]|jgi:exodeoxyribonuclease VII small subunit|nr:exodeoxyribonuclease VII small subunit [Gemmataceae bacterium]